MCWHFRFHFKCWWICSQKCDAHLSIINDEEINQMAIIRPRRIQMAATRKNRKHFLDELSNRLRWRATRKWLHSISNGIEITSSQDVRQTDRSDEIVSKMYYAQHVKCVYNIKIFFFLFFFWCSVTLSPVISSRRLFIHSAMGLTTLDRKSPNLKIFLDDLVSEICWRNCDELQVNRKSRRRSFHFLAAMWPTDLACCNEF